jgi:hypothetical protein
LTFILKSTQPIFFLLLLAAVLFPFCQKEKFTTDSAKRVTFSTDTLRFDTVFTEIGSATQIFKIYNPHKESIRLSRIYLEQGAQSKFNLNIDGIAGDDQKDLEIAPKDSLYVFAEVTINPDAPLSISPFILNEHLIIESNGNSDKIVLEAFGQNANYIPSRFDADSINAFGCDGGEWLWDDPKPYVIYGVLVIDECTVRIPAGTHIYVHGGLSTQIVDNEAYTYNDGFFAFQGSGKLIIEGTKGNPVIFDSDRLEADFDDVSGQWTGLWLQTGTRGHKIEHCIVRNSIVGIRVDSAADLSIKNSQIYNTSSSGLIGIHAKIEAENCLFYNNTGFCIQIEYGGDYRFDYCTAASYGVDGEAIKMGNALCLDAGCATYVSNPLKARMRNCIFFGSKADQLTLFDRVGDGTQFDYKMENCVVRVLDLLKADAYPDFLTHCDPCLNLNAQDTLFVNPSEQVYRLDTLSSRGNGYGKPISGLDFDLENKARDANTPDVGCFENEIK